jgi:hypothetical protein
VAGSMYLIAIVVTHLLTSKLRPVALERMQRG